MEYKILYEGIGWNDNSGYSYSENLDWDEIEIDHDITEDELKNFAKEYAEEFAGDGISVYDGDSYHINVKAWKGDADTFWDDPIMVSGMVKCASKPVD